MIRNLKALGLTLVAVFALSALAASTAAAQAGKITSTGPVTLTGEDTGATGSNAFTVFGSSITCPHSTYTGHKAKTTPHALVPVNATEVTVTPHYKQTSGATANCDVHTAAGTFSGTVTMNGCDYRFYDFTTEAPPGTGVYTFLTDIECPKEAAIAVHIYFSHSHTASNECATMTIGPQTGLIGGTAKTTGGVADDIDLTGTITGVDVTKHSSSFLCPEETTTEGKYHLDVTVKGHNTLKQATGVTITD